MPTLRRLMKDDTGVAMVEFALVLPLLLMLVFGILDFGRALNYWNDTTHLANEAARFAAVDRNPSDSGSLQNWIRDQGISDELRDGSSSVGEPLMICLSYPNATSDVGDPVKVEATFQFKWLKILGLPLTTNIKSSSTMRLEAEPEDVLAGCSS